MNATDGRGSAAAVSRARAASMFLRRLHRRSEGPRSRRSTGVTEAHGAAVARAVASTLPSVSRMRRWAGMGQVSRFGAADALLVRAERSGLQAAKPKWLAAVLSLRRCAPTLRTNGKQDRIRRAPAVAEAKRRQAPRPRNPAASLSRHTA